jgi:pimeloyl-ACP methyl ester carboxylesterase
MIHSLVLPGHGRIHAESDGAGPAVVFVHADFVDGRMWNGVRAQLHGYRTVAYDKLGFGRSDPATGPVVRRQELEAVIDALGLGAVHLVGCSNGGQQALDYALEHPDRVLSLTLINSSPSGWAPQGEPPALLMDMIAAIQRGDLAAASELQLRIWFDGPERNASGLSGELLQARELAGAMNRVCVDRGTFFLADAEPPEPLDPPASGRLGELRVPTVVIDGRWDWAENRRASRLLAAIRGARLVEVDAAHVPPLEDPIGIAELWKSTQG